MKAHVIKYWDRLRSSFWFLPSLMALGAIALSFLSVSLDKAVTDEWLASQSWAYTGGAEGASLVLSTVAGSMITIAGVVFSMTLVALSLASSQLGPRLLRNFMRDTANQVVLGTFVATFLYCLLVLRTIRRQDEDLFVPHLSVSIGVLCALVSLGVLIYFIHHVSVSIQADEVVARVGNDLIETIQRLYSARARGTAVAALPVEASLPRSFAETARGAAAQQDGYVQFVDNDALVALATRCDVLLQITVRPGRYAIKDQPIARVWPPERATDDVCKDAAKTFVLGRQRTSTQDAGFAVHQLVEIAVRALSPSTNDPYTAMSCIDALTSALCRLAVLEPPSTHHFDEDGHLRIVTTVPTFETLLGDAFDEIRRYAAANTAVSMRLLESIARVAAVAQRPDDIAALDRQAAIIARTASRSIAEREDRRAVDACHREAERALSRAG